jgi:hypothetical protein
VGRITDYRELAQKLKPYITPWIVAQGNSLAAAPAAGGLATHALNGAYHSGTLAQSQAPWAVTDDEFATHTANPDAHHNQTHGIVSGDHTASGLTAGHVVRASAATAFAFAQLQHGDLGGVTANQHHNQVHGIVSADHTVTGAALDLVGLSGTNTLAVLTPSSNPGATAKILKTAADGSITLQAVTVNESFYAAATAFRVINHTHDYPHAHVVVNPGVSWTLDEQFGVDIDDNLLVRGWIVGKHAIQLAGALLIAHYDGPEPYATNYKGEPNGHMGQVATVAGSVVYRPGKFGKAVQVAAAVTNMVTNPSLETAATSYVTDRAGATLTRVATYAYVGAYSLKWDGALGSGPANTYFNIGTLAASTAYSFSAYIRRSDDADLTGAAGSAIRMYLDSTGGELTPTARVAVGGGWYRFYVSRTTGGTPNGYVGFVQLDGNYDYYMDGFMVQTGSHLSPYCDGSLGGYTAAGVPDGSAHTWSGTAHASTSSRTVATLSYPVAGNLLPNVGTIAAWVWVDGNNSDNACGIIDAGSAWPYFVLYVASGTTPTFILGNSGGNTSITGPAMSVRGWHYIAATWDSVTGVAVVYTNGVAGTPAAGFYLPMLGTGINVGALPTLGNRQLNGLIDDLVILNRAASADEIRAVYESNAPVFAETSTWHWRSGRNRVYSDAEGLWMTGASGSAVLGAYAGDDANLSATKSWGGMTMAEGDVVIGHNQSGSAAMFWDRSAGKFQFVGNGSATVQAEIDTQGRVSAGAGKIVLGSNGARLALGSSRTTYLSTTDGARIMWSAAELYETLEEEYTYLSTTYYRRSLVARTVTGFGANVSRTEIAALHETTSGSGVYRGPTIILESGASLENYTPTYSVDDLIVMDADMLHITANRVRIEDDTATSYVEIYQGNSSGAKPTLTLSQSDLSEELIRFSGTVATGNPINTDALGSYYGRVRVSVNGTIKWLALYN